MVSLGGDSCAPVAGKASFFANAAFALGDGFAFDFAEAVGETAFAFAFAFALRPGGDAAAFAAALGLGRVFGDTFFLATCQRDLRLQFDKKDMHSPKSWM